VHSAKVPFGRAKIKRGVALVAGPAASPGVGPAAPHLLLLADQITDPAKKDQRN